VAGAWAALSVVAAGTAVGEAEVGSTASLVIVDPTTGTNGTETVLVDVLHVVLDGEHVPEGDVDPVGRGVTTPTRGSVGLIEGAGIVGTSGTTGG